MKLKRFAELGLSIFGSAVGIVLVMLAASGIPQPKTAFAAPLACVPGPHSGAITGTQTWCAADSPHLVDGDVTVPEGMTLTVEAGVIVQGADNVELLVAGHLEALGTAGQPITFTSSADTGPEQWSGLVFDGGSGYLRHATVRYAGDRNSVSDNMFGNPYQRTDLIVRNGSLRLENVTVRDLSTDNHDYGLIASESHLIISDTLFTGLGGGIHADSDVAVRLSGPDTVLEMSGCTFTGNANDRVLLDPGAMMGHDTTLAAQPVLEGYEYRDEYTVPPTVTLTIEPGVTFMSGIGGWGVPQEFIVEGHLQALGTPTQPVTFTSVADSAPGQWPGLVFDGGTGYLRYATVRYAGWRNRITDAALGNWARSGIAIRDVLTGGLHLENVTVRDITSSNQDIGVLAQNSTLVVTDSLFTGIGDGSYYVFPDTPLYIAGGDSLVTLTNNTFANNDTNTVVLQVDAMMNHDTTLTAQNGLDGYVLEDDFTVPPTVTLTLEPGVTMMGGDDKTLKVQGHLDALGTASQPITFTSVTTHASGWEGLIFDGRQGAGTGNLRHVTVMRGGDPVYPDLPGLANYWGGDIYVRGVLSGEVRLENTRVISATGFGAWGTRSSDYGVYVDNSRVVISGTLFHAIGDGLNSSGGDQDYPLHISGASSVVTLTNNTFSDNHQDRARLVPGAMMSHDTSLPSQNGLEGYVLDDDFTVPPTVTLTLEPGVTVMGTIDTELRVEGHLDAIGTPTQPITFTSSANTGANQWAGIIFVGGTGDIQHATVRYGGRGTSLTDGYHRGSNIAAYDVITGEVQLENVTIESEYHFDGWHHFQDHGIYINNSHVVVADSTIRDNGDGQSADSGIYVTGASSVVTLTNNLFQNNWTGLDLNAGSRAILTNNAFADHTVSSLRVKNARAAAWHTTFARGATQLLSSYQPAGIFASDGGSAVLTNTILSHLGTAVRVDPTSAVTLTYTLWDHNTTDVVGTLSESGHLDGLALFDTDGYHLTRYSAAINRGVDAGVDSDIDGDSRPLPAGTLPDLGADEIAASLDELAPEMEAYPLQWVAAVDPASKLPYSRFEQRYLIALYYGSPDANPPAIDVAINDTLPPGLAYEMDEHNPAMTLSQQGQALTWQTVAPLPVDETAQVLFSAVADTLTPGDVLTNTVRVDADASQFNLTHTFQVPLFPPLITTPGNGEICTSAELSGTQVVGVAQADAVVHLYENGVEILTATSPISGIFTLVYTSTHVGVDAQTTLTATACSPASPAQCSAASNAVTLKPVQSFWCPQASSWIVPPDEPYAGQYEFKDPDTGEFTTEDWVIVGPHHFPPSAISLRLPDRGAQPPPPYITVDGNRIDPTNTPTRSPWQYNFPVPMRPYDILFWNNLDPLEHSDGGRLIDPDGYIFDVTQGFDPISPTIHAVQGVTVTCMVSMPAWGGWTPWPAHLYNNQQNPQVTGEDGYFAFFTPPGDYYLQVEGVDGYQSWRSPVVTVISDIVHVNVPYTPWPAGRIGNSSSVMLTIDGPEPAVITVPVGSAVEWTAESGYAYPPEMRMRMTDDPLLQPLSDLDPISYTVGWDGGKMTPGQVYRRRFATMGTYDYSDGAGHSGQVVVVYAHVYLPLVLR